ncbi:DinB family protein [Aureitalea sp. L0-47]|uniref:DinB family protein n=1 Tax=Aureitalea sp. L0-47 TaxID=2816962 RepID=UPI002237C2AD|nr:DinB family protein [Aureitalea sp. L0-47]MCW5518753.1 DinB family protein [Aureitalea sp. L0-47]
METGKQLAKRIREVFLDGTWIANSNYTKALSGLSMEEACRKVEQLNSIAALTFHVNYYLGGVLKFLNGGTLDISDSYSFDMSPITSEEDWNGLRLELKDNAEKFAEKVDRMSDTDLNQVFADPKYGTIRRNIEGLIEHSYYHLGQISLLRKLIAAS